EKEFLEVLNWLSVVDPDPNFSSALEVREPGTGAWLLEGCEYMDWKEGRGGVLWLYGIPGCGKSVLSATAIEDVQRLCRGSNDHALAYFYFTFSDPEKQNLVNMLLSIIGQLVEGLAGQDFPDEVMNLYRKSKGKPPNIKAVQAVFLQIIKLSKRLFRWVDCLLRILEECISPKAVRAALKELPEDLDSVYLRILDSIHKTQREYVRRAMNWLAFSAKPLTLGQLAEAVVIEYDVNKYGEDPETLFDMKSLMSICPNLISFEDARYDESSPQEDRPLRLAHFSVKEYLISERAACGPGWLGIYNPDDAHRFRSHSSTVYSPALYYAALLNLVTACKLLVGKMEDSENVNAQGGSYGNALQAAAAHGNESVVQLLLNRGAEVNAQGGDCGNALQAAAVHGNESVVQLLLNRRAEVDAQGGYYGNALQAAAVHGNKSVVQLLLNRGAEMNAQGDYYGHALQAAPVHGNESVVQLLLERGAEVNAQGGRYGNALQAAKARGHGAVSQLLLKHGAYGNI
ncbi:ankyrin, partial [Tuber magnatum]